MTDVQPEAAVAPESELEQEAEPEVVIEPATEPDSEPELATPREPAFVPIQHPPPAFRVMDVEDVSLDLPAQYPSVTLVEVGPPMRSLVFPVGLTEGTALAQALRRMPSPRPMTHELFIDALQRVHVDVVAVRLIGRENGNYLAELDLMAPHGRERMDCRPSDGLVLALRMPVAAPILVDERLLEEPGEVVPQER